MDCFINTTTMFLMCVIKGIKIEDDILYILDDKAGKVIDVKIDEKMLRDKMATVNSNIKVEIKESIIRKNITGDFINKTYEVVSLELA